MDRWNKNQQVPNESREEALNTSSSHVLVMLVVGIHCRKCALQSRNSNHFTTFHTFIIVVPAATLCTFREVFIHAAQ